MMKTAQYIGNKSFSIVEMDKVPPESDEVQIKVAYCGICGTDIHIYHGMMDQRVNIPLAIGHEMSGVITAIGKDVNGFSISDKVVVRPLDSRGQQASDNGISHICKNLKFLGIDSPGAMQQYWNVPSFVIHKLPDHTDLKLAALVEPLSVACHDVRLSNLIKGETAVILGGGPIGMLIALVAKSKGADVYISEVNPARIKIANELGLQTIDPSDIDIVNHINQITDGRLADVVFEVAGVQATVDIMTKLAGIRGRVVMVAIHGEPKSVDLFSFFWKELKLIGARVYEKEDYDEAIKLITENQLPFEKMITSVEPLSSIQSVFDDMDKNFSGMKVLLDCQH